MAYSSPPPRTPRLWMRMPMPLPYRDTALPLLVQTQVQVLRGGCGVEAPQLVHGAIRHRHRESAVQAPETSSCSHARCGGAGMHGCRCLHGRAGVRVQDRCTYTQAATEVADTRGLDTGRGRTATVEDHACAHVPLRRMHVHIWPCMSHSPTGRNGNNGRAQPGACAAARS